MPVPHVLSCGQNQSVVYNGGQTYAELVNATPTAGPCYILPTGHSAATFHSSGTILAPSVPASVAALASANRTESHTAVLAPSALYSATQRKNADVKTDHLAQVDFVFFDISVSRHRTVVAF